MLAASLVRDHPDVVRAGLRRRHDAESERVLGAYLALEEEVRAARRRHHALWDERRAGAGDRAREDELHASILRLSGEAQALLKRLPNLPEKRVPDGAGPADNQEIARWGEPPRFDFAPRPHHELGHALGLIDLGRATKLSGRRFPLYLGLGARLVRALAALMLDLHAQAGYTEVMPPHLLRESILEGSGHLPRHADDLYAIPSDHLRLSPTAEAQLVALHAQETILEAALPLAYTAWTPCFRREAGSAGSATRGLLRQHQFEKVELVRLATPQAADDAFDAIQAQAERVLRALELPYRVVALCAGELPWTAERTVDLEVWMPAQGHYVEVSSISGCGTYQARGLGLLYQPQGGGRPQYPYTLNGSALAIGRTLAALLENGQCADGSVALPQALAPYLPELPDRVLQPKN